MVPLYKQKKAKAFQLSTLNLQNQLSCQMISYHNLIGSADIPIGMRGDLPHAGDAVLWQQRGWTVRLGIRDNRKTLRGNNAGRCEIDFTSPREVCQNLVL